MSNPIENLKNLSNSISNVSNINETSVDSSKPNNSVGLCNNVYMVGVSSEENFLRSNVDDIILYNMKDNYKDMLYNSKEHRLKDMISNYESKSNLTKLDLIKLAIAIRYTIKDDDFIGIYKSLKRDVQIDDLFKFCKDDSYYSKFGDFNPVIKVNDFNYGKANRIVIELNDNIYTEITGNFKYYNTYRKNSIGEDIKLISSKGSDYINGEFDKHINDFCIDTESKFRKAVIASDLINHYICDKHLFNVFLDNIMKFDKLKFAYFDDCLFTDIIAGIKYIYLDDNELYTGSCVGFIKNYFTRMHTVYSYSKDCLGNYLNLFNLKPYYFNNKSVENSLYEEVLFDYIKSAYRILLGNVYPRFDVKYIYEEAKRYLFNVYDVKSI